MQKRKFSFIGFMIGWFARLLYLAALTSLIPFGAIFLTSPPEQMIVELGSFPFFAIGLLFLSVIVLLAYHHNLGRTLCSLGWITLIPGLFAPLFVTIDRQAVIDFFAKYIFGLGKIQPYVASYLDEVLPRVWLFIFVYIILGFTLIYLAGKMEYEHTLMSHFRKIFGPRVKFYR